MSGIYKVGNVWYAIKNGVEIVSGSLFACLSKASDLPVFGDQDY